MTQFNTAVKTPVAQIGFPSVLLMTIEKNKKGFLHHVYASTQFCRFHLFLDRKELHYVLEPESEERAKNVDFHTAKNVQIQATLMLYF